MKICFITSLFGNRGNLPGNLKRVEGFDYFLFSDRCQKSFENSNWDVHNISSNPNICNLKCNIRKSRYAKFLGWELLNSMGLSYDFVYYSDVHYTPRSDVDWVSLSKYIMDSNIWAQQLHWGKSTQIKGILEELRLIVGARRDSKENIEKTIKWFKKNYPNVDLSAPVYYRNGHLGYSTQDDLFQKISKEFWNQYITSDISMRDQPFWNVLLKEYNLKPLNLDFLRMYLEDGEYGDHRYA